MRQAPLQAEAYKQMKFNKDFKYLHGNYIKNYLTQLNQMHIERSGHLNLLKLKNILRVSFVKMNYKHRALLNFE